MPPFAIGRYPVTVYEYDVYLQDEGLTPHKDMWFEGQRPFPNLPVVSITAAEAESYCQWASKRTGTTVRLPREKEWEYAARGGGNPRRFPWGKEKPDVLHANFNNAVGRPTAIGLFPKGATSPLVPGEERTRIYDLAGNVWEWTANSYELGSIQRVLRGGSFSSTGRYLRSACRDVYRADGRYDLIGFRCLREVHP